MFVVADIDSGQRSLTSKTWGTLLKKQKNNAPIGTKICGLEDITISGFFKKILFKKEENVKEI